MKIISKSRIGMASDKLDCDEFMKFLNQVLDKWYHLFKLIRNAAFFIKIKISLEITEM